MGVGRYTVQAFLLLVVLIGNIVMVFPKYQYKNEWIRIEILEKIKKIGFAVFPSTLQGEGSGVRCLTYHRPTQHLAREIWRFKKGS